MKLLDKISKWFFGDWKTTDKLPKWALNDFNRKLKKRKSDDKFGVYYIQGQGTTYKIIVKQIFGIHGPLPGYASFYKEVKKQSRIRKKTDRKTYRKRPVLPIE